MGRITGLYIPMFVFTPWAPFTSLTLRPEPPKIKNAPDGTLEFDWSPVPDGRRRDIKFSALADAAVKIYGADNRTVYSHVRFHSMGPFHFAIALVKDFI